MERVILSDLGFVLGHPTPESFFKSQCKQLSNVKPPIRALARLIMELTLIHRRFRPFRSSLLAIASLILADSLHTCRFWTHSEPLLGRIISNLEECLIQAPRQIIEKYRSGKFLNISLHVRAMLDNKAAYLYQSRLNSTPSMATAEPNVGAGLITPPKDPTYYQQQQHQQQYAQMYNQMHQTHALYRTVAPTNPLLYNQHVQQNFQMQERTNSEMSTFSGLGSVGHRQEYRMPE
ncbi:UNVERIFIED_CONTAM: hypothetical protein HDU68_003382 [Siphonaria sp. JEL0065]|nr:hypothetical protein HDU68_003382 [Siphonaria sp. JEL0065]